MAKKKNRDVRNNHGTNDPNSAVVGQVSRPVAGLLVEAILRDGMMITDKESGEKR